MNHLEKLKTLMPPITPPPESVVDWEMAEDVFGLEFPTDFKRFISTYGNVIWCDLFRAIYPETSSRQACESSRDDILNTVSVIGSDELYDIDGNVVDIPWYPTPGGLLPCLTDTNSDFVLWRTEGSPDDWTTITYCCGNIFPYPCNITQLICDWIGQKPPADQAWSASFLDPTKYGIER